jgi:Ca2+-binding EF-hand superfamily protein
MELWKCFKARVDENDESEEEIKNAFQNYDIDGDGYITKDEMVTVIKSLFMSLKGSLGILLMI